MRRLAAAIALTLFAVAPAGAHPGHGGEAVTIEGDAFRYSPPSARIAVGEPVVWFWQGTLARNHSVTADPGQAEQFDSDPAGPPTNATHPEGDSFSHVFTHEGQFWYHCKVHAEMQGFVEVVQLPGQGERLRLRKLKVAPRDERIEVRFRLSAAADLALRIAERREGRWQTVKTLYRKADSGKNLLKLPIGRLDDGRYRLSLAAYDEANRRVEAKDRFSLD
jgi:plastocyanin